MNLVQVAGHLGSDPETRVTPNGQKVTTFRIANNVRRNGKDETIWWRITVWGDRFDRMMPYLKKGSAVIVVGEMGKPEIYTDKEGNAQVSLNITADIIRFSPFGKSEKQGTNETANSAFGSETSPFASYSQPIPAGFGAMKESSYDDLTAQVDNDQLPF